jgi:hypothetical protein
VTFLRRKIASFRQSPANLMPSQQGKLRAEAKLAPLAAAAALKFDCPG